MMLKLIASYSSKCPLNSIKTSKLFFSLGYIINLPSLFNLGLFIGGLFKGFIFDTITPTISLPEGSNKIARPEVHKRELLRRDVLSPVFVPVQLLDLSLIT